MPSPGVGLICAWETFLMPQDGGSGPGSVPYIQKLPSALRVVMPSAPHFPPLSGSLEVPSLYSP